MTLIELMVSMTIFIIVVTLAIGGFISMNRARLLVGNMKDSQQKARVANEMIVRYAKQAESISISSDGKTLELYFDQNSTVQGVVASAKKFVLDGNDLKYYECQVPPVGDQCPNQNWSTGASLLGNTETQSSGITISNPASGVFSLNGVLPSVLEVDLELQNKVAGYTTLDDNLSIKNAVILEGLK